MKQFFILLACAALSTGAFAQSKYIEYRKVLDNGEKISIKTNPVEIKEKKQQTIGLSFMYETSMKEDPDKTGYSLFITFISDREDWIVPYGGKLLIRTGSGKVISLIHSIKDGITLYRADNGFENNVYSANEFVRRNEFSGTAYYRKFGKYPIDEADLALIMEEGIIKIRLETTGSNVECEYPEVETVKINRKKEQRNIVSHLLQPYYNALLDNIDPYNSF